MTRFEFCSPTARFLLKSFLQKISTHSENALEQEGAIVTLCFELAKLFPQLYAKVARKNRSHEEKAEGILELTDLENLVQEYQHSEHSGPESREARRYLVEQRLAAASRKRKWPSVWVSPDKLCTIS